MSGSSRREITDLGWTPTMRSTSRPPWKIRSVGMLWRPKRAAVAGFSSTLSFATRTRPANSAASSSITGAIIRQGPHHAAHASTSTGCGERSTSAENDASVTTIGLVSTRRGVPHRPHTGSSPWSILARGTRLPTPQAVQRTTSATESVVISVARAGRKRGRSPRRGRDRHPLPPSAGSHHGCRQHAAAVSGKDAVDDHAVPLLQGHVLIHRNSCQIDGEGNPAGVRDQHHLVAGDPLHAPTHAHGWRCLNDRGETAQQEETCGEQDQWELREVEILPATHWCFPPRHALVPHPSPAHVR